MGAAEWAQLGGSIAGPILMAASSETLKTDILPLSEADDEEALERLTATNLFKYRYKDASVQRKGMILEDPTTPEELKYGQHIDLYAYMAEITSALRALSRRVG